MSTLSLETPTPSVPEINRLDEIACDGCGRFFHTTDGPGMLAAIVGACPDCGGAFALAGPSA